MDDLISRQAVLELPRNITRNFFGKIVEESIDVERIEALPSAQPEIIRCKDCKNWDTTWTNDFAPNYHYCPMVDGTRKSDFYCADAERRTDEQTKD